MNEDDHATKERALKRLREAVHALATSGADRGLVTDVIGAIQMTFLTVERNPQSMDEAVTILNEERIFLDLADTYDSSPDEMDMKLAATMLEVPPSATIRATVRRLLTAGDREHPISYEQLQRTTGLTREQLGQIVSYLRRVYTIRRRLLDDRSHYGFWIE